LTPLPRTLSASRDQPKRDMDAVIGRKAKSFTHRRIAEPILELEREHELVLAEIASLRKAVMNGRRQGARSRLVIQTMSSIRHLDSLLKTHQSREETLLLPIVQEHLDSAISTALTSEHIRISKELRKLQQIAGGSQPSGRKKHFNTLATLITEFDSLLREHFLREENILFWYASLFLPESGSTATVNSRRENVACCRFTMG
jgi:iron-sulfur cluster repair protein YtfE (RIC family)